VGRFCVDLRADAPVADAPAADALVQEDADAAVSSFDASPDATTDARADAPLEADAPPPCNTSAPFGTATPVSGLGTLSITTARFTPDAGETTMIFSALNGCTDENCWDLYFATRPDLVSPFGQAELLPGVNVNVRQASQYWPTMTSDQLLLFFESSRSVTPGPDGGYLDDQARVWTAVRPNLTADWQQPYLQSEFQNIPGAEGSPYVLPNGQWLYFISAGRPGGKGNLDIWVAELGQFGSVTAFTNIDAINTTNAESAPVVTLDNLTLYFARTDALTNRHIMVSSRKRVSDPFGPPAFVTELNTSGEEFPSWISDDQCRLYFSSDRAVPNDAGAAGIFRLWVAARPK
jgi:hypothetical protein